MQRKMLITSNHHTTHIQTRLVELWEKKELIDAYLLCEGRAIPVHKFVLTSFSEVLKRKMVKIIVKAPFIF